MRVVFISELNSCGQVMSNFFLSLLNWPAWTKFLDLLLIILFLEREIFGQLEQCLDGGHLLPEKNNEFRAQFFVAQFHLMFIFFLPIQIKGGKWTECYFLRHLNAVEAMASNFWTWGPFEAAMVFNYSLTFKMHP